MEAQVKLIEMVAEGRITVASAEILLKAMNNNEDSGQESSENKKKTKRVAKKKKVKKAVKKVNKKAVKKQVKKKTVKKKKTPLITVKKGASIQLDQHGNILADGKPVGESDNNRPYQKSKESGR